MLCNLKQLTFEKEVMLVIVFVRQLKCSQARNYLVLGGLYQTRWHKLGFTTSPIQQGMIVPCVSLAMFVLFAGSLQMNHGK